jgi:hypothetical protein
LTGGEGTTPPKGWNSGPSGHLLILACSKTKNHTPSPAPAIHIYDGVNFRVIRKTFRERGWPPGLQIKILSAKYGLIDATKIIKPYDQRLDKKRATGIKRHVVSELAKVPAPKTVFVNLGAEYLPAVDGLQQLFPESEITYAEGAIGLKMKAMKNWLENLHFQTATLKGYSKKAQSYLYFFPDWDDFIREPFTSDDTGATEVVRRYAHEICGNGTPYDGMLLSLAQIHVHKGILNRLNGEGSNRIYLRRRLHIPKDIILFGDCGAFSYASESRPLE